MAYNDVYVFVAFDVLAAAQLNNNDGNLDFLKSQVDEQICNGRLTLETGVAVSTTDQTAKTTVYFTPVLGNKIGLYDSSASTWDLYTFVEKSLALTGLIKGVVYDIFGYLSAGVLALESLAWKKVTASNSPTAGSNKTINLSDTTGLVVGMEVTVKDGSNSEVTNITAVVASTSITVDTLAASYTTPDVYGYPTRATALTLNSGVWTKSGDTTRRYLGTLRITTTTGQCEDSTSRRYVWNLHNRVARPLKCTDLTASWSYTSGTWRASNASVVYGTGRFGFVIGINDQSLYAIFGQTLTTANVSYIGIALDDITRTSGSDHTIHGAAAPGVAEVGTALAVYQGVPGIGNHFLQKLEFGNAGTTYLGTGGQSAMVGKIEM